MTTAHEVTGATARPQADPRTREQWRGVLLREVESISETLERDALVGEQTRQLPASTANALRSCPNLVGMKLPADLGGAEADNALQFEIFEQVAYHNSAASWCLFIYADQIGRAGAWLPQAGLDTVFSDGVPIICGGGGLLLGNLTPAPGGWHISGDWVYGSGIHGSDWVNISGAEKPADGDPPKMILCTVPRHALTLDDNWNVLGMRGTGSVDFHARNVFVPHELTWAMEDPPRRGGALFQISLIGYVTHTVPATALGVARRALDEVKTMAASKARGYTSRKSLAERGAFQAFLGEADLRIKAARELMLENGRRVVADADRLGIARPENEAETRAAATYVTRVAGDVVREAVNFAGGSAIREGSRLEQAVRDVQVAANHYIVSNVSYESHAQFLLGLAEADPTA